MTSLPWVFWFGHLKTSPSRGEVPFLCQKTLVTHGLRLMQNAQALKKYKIDYLSWRSVNNIDELPPLCVLGVDLPKYSVLYYDGNFFAPEFGVLESYTPEGKITNYLEHFIDEIYENRQTSCPTNLLIDHFLVEE